MSDQRATSRWGSFFRPVAPPPLQMMSASAAQIDLSNRVIVRNVLKARAAWQEQTIDTIHAVGELYYGLAVLSSLVSRVTLFVAEIPDNKDSTPVRVDGSSGEEATAVAALERLGNPVTRTDIQYDMAFNLLGPGELYLIYIAPRPELGIPDGRWETRSIREIESIDSSIRITDYVTGEAVVLDKAKGDTFIRIWRPDPFAHDKATSHVRAILSAAEELLWWDSNAQAVAKARHTMAGLIGIPSNLEVPAEEDDPPELQGSDRFIYRVMNNMMTAVGSPGSAEQSVPILFSYPWNESGKSGLEVITMDRPQDELMVTRTKDCLVRIEQGINLPVGVLSGLGNATHWGAGQISESEFRDHVEPLVLLMCSALTRSYLVPSLRKPGTTADTSRYFVWYDASALIAHRDKAQNAIRAVELNLIGPPAARRDLGYSERDAPTPDESQQMLEWLSAVRRGTGQQGIVPNPSEPNENPSDPSAPPQENAPGERTSEDDKTIGTRGRGRPVTGSASTNGDGVDPVLVAQLQVMCEEKVRRALEIAGNRLANRAKKEPSFKEALRGVRAAAVAPTLGRKACIKLGVSDVFDGAFDDLFSRVVAYAGLDMVPEHAVSKLKDRLHELAATALYTPPAPGDVLVRSDIIVEALHRKEAVDALASR